MSKTVVVYESKYGYTRKYAQWIAEELDGDLYERKKVKAVDLLKYDTIIYGGGLYAGGVSGIDLIVKSFEQIKDKKLVLFTCGLADPEDSGNVNHIRESLRKVLSTEMMEKIMIYHLRGGINYGKLGMVHKSMMAMLHKVMAKKDYNSLREEDKQMLDTYGKEVDFTNRD